MPAYVTFDGSADSYFSSPDVNLLDADSAHFHQSVGDWTAGAGASALAQDTGGTPTPQFGDGTAKATTDGTGAVIASITTPTLAAVEHTVSIDIYTDTADREAFITLDGTDGTVTALTAGTWTRITATKTVTVGTKTVTVTYRQTDDSDPGASEEVWLDQATLVTGTDGSFVRSLRIVGDIDLECKAAVQWQSTTQNSLISKDSLAERSYRLYGGLRAGKYTTIGADFNGTSGPIFTWATSPALSNGDIATVRVTRIKATGVCTGYINGVASTNNPVTLAGTAIAVTNSVVEVGSVFAGTLQNANGDIYWATVRDGIDGPIVAKFDAEDWVGV